MAAVERGEGASDAVVKGWLARALSAPRGPQWVCDNCHHIHPEWVPACENCQSFDTLSWTAPPESTVTTSTGVEMLPLIVGVIEDNSDMSDDAADKDIQDAELVDDAAEEASDEAAEDAPKDGELLEK